jgi:hypothetical protein
VADAIKDCSRRGGLVLDPFCGSGTRIEQVVQPTAQQQSAFNDLKNAAQKAGIVLSMSRRVRRRWLRTCSYR